MQSVFTVVILRVFFFSQWQRHCLVSDKGHSNNTLMWRSVRARPPHELDLSSQLMLISAFSGHIKPTQSSTPYQKSTRGHKIHAITNFSPHRPQCLFSCMTAYLWPGPFSWVRWKSLRAAAKYIQASRDILVCECKPGPTFSVPVSGW